MVISPSYISHRATTSYSYSIPKDYANSEFKIVAPDGDEFCFIIDNTKSIEKFTSNTGWTIVSYTTSLSSGTTRSSVGARSNKSESYTDLFVNIDWVKLNSIDVGSISCRRLSFDGTEWLSDKGV